MGIKNEKNEDIFLVWGKSDRANRYNYKSLFYHLIDAGCTAQYYWQNILPDSTKKWLSKKSGIEINLLGKLIPYFTALHDIGKATPGFQNKVQDLTKVLRMKKYKFPHSSKPHGILTTNILETKWTKLKKVDRGHLRLTLAIGGHHGKFPERREINLLSQYDTGNEKWQNLQNIIINNISQLFNDCNNPFTILDKKTPNEFFVYLSGYISVMDWISSSEEFFPYASKIKKPDEYQKMSKKYAQRAFEAMQWNRMEQDNQDIQFEKLFPTMLKPRPLQIEIKEIINAFHKPGIVLIEAPTGEGKTEAAFLAHEIWKKKLDQNGAYIALPTQATANQIFKRTKEYLTNAREGREINLHLLHGNAFMSKEYQTLQASQITQDIEQTLVANSWFTYRKRGLISSYGVGTIDQALLSVLKTPHFFVRMFGLANKTIIVDEVHAYDVYMSSIFERALEWFGAMNCSVILLSATLPSSKRKSLLEKYAGKTLELPTLKYPRIIGINEDTQIGKEIEPSIFKEHPNGKNIKLTWIENNITTLENILVERLTDGGNVAIICNTVFKAQNLFTKLKESCDGQGIELDLLHSQFPNYIKNVRIERCIKQFGKDRQEDKVKRVLISTQIIEQSLDLDFDLMISEVAPVDLIIQRMGRLHRHTRKRPDKLANANIILFKPSLEDNIPRFGPEAYFYSDYILLKTYQLLKDKDHINIPNDIEPFIESVYELETDGSDYELCTAIKDAESRYEADKASSQQIAKSKVIPKPDFKDLFTSLRSDLKEDSPETHKSLQALTRLSELSIPIVCLYNNEGKVFLRPDGTMEVDPNEISNKDIKGELINNTVNVSNRLAVDHLQKIDTYPSWKNSSLLRNHRPILFKHLSGQKYYYKLNDITLNLDNELGLFIKKDRGRSIESSFQSN